MLKVVMLETGKRKSMNLLEGWISFLNLKFFKIIIQLKTLYLLIPVLFYKIFMVLFWMVNWSEIFSSLAALQWKVLIYSEFCFLFASCMTLSYVVS
jgi:hypothetical protein